MNSIPVLAWIFQGIPESIAIIFASVSFLGVNGKEKLHFIILFGLVEACFIYLIRTLPVSLGVPTILSVFTITFWSYIISKKSFINCFISASLVIIILLFYEFFFYILMTSIFNLSRDLILSNIMLRAILGLPQVIMLFITGIFVKKIYYRMNK